MVSIKDANLGLWLPPQGLSVCHDFSLSQKIMARIVISAISVGSSDRRERARDPGDPLQ